MVNEFSMLAGRLWEQSYIELHFTILYVEAPRKTFNKNNVDIY